MKACVLEAVGELQYREVPTPEPKRNEVLLKIMACGICSSDVDRVFKTGTYNFPTIPGHEFSGQIVALGEGVDAALLHRRAAVFPLLPCFQCPSCSIGEYARCDHYNYFGSRCDGAFAEYLAVPVWNLVLFADTLSYEAAALCEPSAVALHATTAAHILPGDTVAVIGNGTIGLLAAMWARIRGASRVIIMGRSKEKLQFARSLGFLDVVSMIDEQPNEIIREMTQGQGADIALEMVGSSQAISAAINSVRKGGTVVLTGNPAQDILLDRATYWKILRSELTLHGTWNSSFNASKNDWSVALEYMSNGQLLSERLITHRFSLEESDKAFEMMQDKKTNTVKVMFETRSNGGK